MLPKRLLASISAIIVAPTMVYSAGLHASGPLNLMQVYELALKNDAQLAAAQATFKAAEELVPQSRAALLPTLGVSAQTADNRNVIDESVALMDGPRTKNFNSHSWSARLSQPLFNLESWFSFKQAGMKTEQAAVTFAIAQQNLILQVAQAYFNILFAQESLATTIAEERALQRQLEQTEQRFEVGLIAQTDVLEARAAYDTSRVSRIDAENEVTLAFENIRVLTNQVVPAVEGLDRNMPSNPPVPAVAEQWVSTAVAQNLSLDAARKGIDIAEQSLKISRTGYAPTLSAVAEYTQADSGQDRQLTNFANQTFMGGENSTNTVFSLQLSIPIFSGLSTVSKVREAGYNLEASQQTFDANLRQISATTRNLFNTINADVSRIKARCRAIESAKSALDATESGYEVGTRNIVDVLQAQQNLYSAQRDYLNARYSFIINTLQLKQNAGTLSPKDLQDLNVYINGKNNPDQPYICG